MLQVMQVAYTHPILSEQKVSCTVATTLKEARPKELNWNMSDQTSTGFMKSQLTDTFFVSL